MKKEWWLMEEIHNWEEGSSASSNDFTIGQVVALRSDPTRVGVIINVFPGTPENRYHVFLDNTPTTYYDSQLQRYEPSAPSSVITPLAAFHAYMTALQLNHPS